GRLLSARVHYHRNLCDPLDFCIIYAPAHSDLRPQFYTLLDHYLSFSTPPPSRSILLGDLNYNTRLHHSSPLPSSWTQWLTHHWCDAITAPHQQPLPTFTTGSTLDYLYVSHDLHNAVTSSTVKYIAGQWTDHHSVNITLDIGIIKQGPGM
ncbi:hypothetical protein CLU79DRAFT_712037, partial [Phycomyces nitens]